MKGRKIEQVFESGFKEGIKGILFISNFPHSLRGNHNKYEHKIGDEMASSIRSIRRTTAGIPRRREKV